MFVSSLFTIKILAYYNASQVVHSYKCLILVMNVFY